MTGVLNRKVQAQSLVDVVAERIEAAIFSGQIEPGSRLSEQGLALSLGVSRGPLREAIRRLEGRKLLERTPNIGVRVAQVSLKDLNEILQMREALEGLACSLAAVHMPDAEIAADIWSLPAHLRPVPVVVLVDEVAELALYASKEEEKRRDRIITALARLAQLGCAAGIYLEICGQRFGSELGKGITMLRAQLTGRTAHRVNDESSANMAFGDIAPDAVLAAIQIPTDMPGVDPLIIWSRAQDVNGSTAGSYLGVDDPDLPLG